MFGGKSAAKTFFSRLFEKEKVKKEEPELIYQRKRSQSLFAPNVAALLSGEHVGGVHGLSCSLAGDPSNFAVPVSLQFADIMTAAEINIETTIKEKVEETVDLNQNRNDDDEDLEYLRLSCDRLHDRRATDFSQANSDLQRFLANRKSKGLEEEDSSPTVDLARRDVIFHKKIYGSVEALDGENQSEERNKRFRIETCSKDQEIMDIPAMPELENPENQTKWYYKYFLGKLHQNLIGQDNSKNVFILSILQEKSFGKCQYRAILWIKEGPKRLRFRSPGKSMTLKQILSNFGHLSKLEKIPREIVNPNIQKDILWLEKQEGSMNFKFGVIYAKTGQIMDDELFSNEAGSQRFDNFLHLLGQRVTLKGWQKFRGGLDIRGNMTGEDSIYTTHEEHEIMFHVSTMLPFSSEDRQQVERKRHIGNDIINIIFVDGDRSDMAKFKPVFIKSQFTHVYAVVCYEEATSSYYLTVYSEKSVPLFGPSLAGQVGFSNHQAFRKFLLVKCINGEKATYNTDVFATKRERTFQILLADAFSQYGKEESKPHSTMKSISDSVPESGRLYSHRRREDSRKDVFVKVGQSLKLENTISGELGVLTPSTPSVIRHNRFKKEAQVGKPWEPYCVFPSLQMSITSGDVWAGVGFLVAASEGGWILRPNKEAEKVFTINSIVQLNIMESLGILIFRTEKIGKDPAQVWVYRLSELETALHALGREELKDHALEASKGCSLYSVSHREHSSLRLAIITAKKVLLYRWLHAEEWITFTADTVEGFELIKEINLVEQPLVMTLIENPVDNSETNEPNGLVLLGNRKGFELLNEQSNQNKQVLSLQTGDIPTVAQELWEDNRMELLVTHSCTSVFMHEVDGLWQSNRKINWNCQPVSVVMAFPYIIALSADSMEIRSPANGSLLQTLNLPKLKLLSFKEDIYFTTTKQGYNVRKNSEMEPMSKFCDPTTHLYKISWNKLVGAGAFNRPSDQDNRPSTPSTSSAEDAMKQSFESCFSRTDSILSQTSGSYQSQSSRNDSCGFSESPGYD